MKRIKNTPNSGIYLCTVYRDPKGERAREEEIPSRLNLFWGFIQYSMCFSGLTNSKYIKYTFTCPFSPKYGKKISLTRDSRTETRISPSDPIKELNNWLPPSWLWKPPPIKISFSAAVMGADLHNVMVTQAVSLSEQKMLFNQINLKSTH